MVPRMGTPASLQAAGEIQRRVWPPNWTMINAFDARFGASKTPQSWVIVAELPILEGAAVETLADIENVFVRQRLEKEQVAGVVIGADGLRVGVDHHGFDAEFLHGEGGVDAAVIEFDPLADAIGAAADDDDFGAVGEADFVFREGIQCFGETPLRFTWASARCDRTPWM